MMRFARPNRPLALPIKPQRLGTLASLTASLLLGACSQSSDMLPGLGLKAPEETSATDSSTPQTELQKATSYWGQQYAKRPTDLQPALNYARDLKAMGEKRKAFAVLQQASMFHKDSRELAGEYGRLALEFGQVGAANELLAIADDPTKPDWRVISARGTVMAKQGKYSDAVPFYERALTLSQDNPTVMNNLAMAYAMMGDPQKAEGLLRQAMTKDGATPKVRENLALVLGLQGRYEESRAVASGVLNAGAASDNTKYIKEMVQLAPKDAMPSAKSFAAQTSVARTAPARVSESKTAANASSSWTTATAQAANSQNVWRTDVDAGDAAAVLKAAAH